MYDKGFQWYLDLTVLAGALILFGRAAGEDGSFPCATGLGKEANLYD